MTSQEHEREREREIKNIATGTNLSPEGGLLPPHHGGRRDDEMSTGDDSPLRQGAEMGSRLVFGGYKALHWRNV